MTDPSHSVLTTALLDRHGRTLAAELDIPLNDPGPSALFRLLCACLLFGARINAGIAVDAARALTEQGWTTAARLADSTFSERAKVLNEAGYARYDERTATALGDTADLLLERYQGDLRRLREKAGGDRRQLRLLLKECKGVGDVGVDIFFREIQGAWDELYPFVDARASRAASELGLPTEAAGLSGLVARDDFPRLVAALVRTQLAKDHASVVGAAGG